MNKNQNEKRKLYRMAASAYNHLDLAMQNCMQLRDIFSHVHPELAEGMDIAMQQALMAQQVILAFASASWSKTKEQLMVYLEN